MTCPKCGAAQTDQASFCWACGTALKGSPSAQSSEPPRGLATPSVPGITGMAAPKGSRAAVWWIVVLVLLAAGGLFVWKGAEGRRPVHESPGASKVPKTAAASAETVSGLRTFWPDMRWGEAPRPDMRQHPQTAKNPDDRSYQRPTDKLSIRGAPLNGVVYSYLRNRLYEIVVTMPPESHSAVESLLASATGPGEKGEDGSTTWVVGDTGVTLSGPMSTGEWMLQFNDMDPNVLKAMSERYAAETSGPARSAGTTSAALDASMEEYRRAVGLLRQVRERYADDEGSLLAQVVDRTEKGVLVFANVLCKNPRSAHCPALTSKHNVIVVDPYPDDVSAAVLRGTYYLLGRSTSTNAYGAAVPVLIYGVPADLRAARERVSALARVLREKGIDPDTGETLERVEARRQEEARQAGEVEQAEADARQRAKVEGQVADLQRSIAAELKSLEGVRSQLEADTRIHEQNLADMRANGSNPKGEMAWFEEHKAALDKQIKAHRDKIAALEAQRAALSTGEN